MTNNLCSPFGHKTRCDPPNGCWPLPLDVRSHHAERIRGIHDGRNRIPVETVPAQKIHLY